MESPPVADHLATELSETASEQQLVVEEDDPLQFSVSARCQRNDPAGQGPQRIPRTMSEDRKMNESFQFYEAVGETESSLMKDRVKPLEIIDSAVSQESSEGDDGESSAYEIQVERLPAHSHAGITEERAAPPLGVLRTPPFRMLSSNSSSSVLQETQGCGSAGNVEWDYKGIGENGLAITRRGVRRGNYSTLHRKAWLEVSDSLHRYGKNLRLYYRHWGSLGYPTNHFFEWLDSKGDAEGQPLPDLPECPRSKLDTDRVLYVSDPEVTRSYMLSIVRTPDRRGQLLDIDGEPISTRPDGWIFVLRDGELYGSRKITTVCRHSKQRFHHSSFFGGKAVSTAGILVTDYDGYLTHLYPHSGHYRPGEVEMQRCLCHLYAEGVDLDTFQFDMQQLVRVGRSHEWNGADAKGSGQNKKCKKNTLYLQPASYVAHYLSHKASCIQDGLFEQIHRIQQVETMGMTVQDILTLVTVEQRSETGHALASNLTQLPVE